MEGRIWNCKAVLVIIVGLILRKCLCQKLQLFKPNRSLQNFDSSALKFGQRRNDLFEKISFLDAKISSSQNNYVISHPSRVDDDGSFVSNHVTYFAQTFSKSRSSSSNKKAKERVDPENIYFKVNINGRKLTLNVSASDQFLHPDFVVEQFLRDHEKEKRRLNPFSSDQASSIRRGTPWNCHLRGHVIGHPNSVVAMSTCDGITGLIRLDDIDYFIEPLASASSEKNHSPRPHKIYKRSVSAGNLPSRKKTSSSRRRQRSKAAFVTTFKRLRKNNQNTDSATKGSFTNQKFCAVTDTKRLYRREMRRRKAWQARRASHTHARRKRRSLSLEHWVEMLVVADHEMVEFHGRDHIEKYVLTIINIVSELFHDVSVGNAIHISLVRLIILDKEEESLMISSHAATTLDSFCRWAKRMNPQSDQHANHHDVAVLLTRRNLCSVVNSSCETLGLAHVAGMCQPHRSCNVNQDTGLSLAFTVAHELGHNFAMHHDGQLNNCEPDDNYPRLMSPQLTSNNLPMRWSSCSRQYITRFLDRNWGFCLEDPPSPEHDQYDMPEELPGLLYDADHQCRLAFGSHSKKCVKVEDHICSRLWCLHKGTCRTRLHSAVPGTKCADGKWCYDGSCVDVHEVPPAVDGSWGPWTQYTRCSRTCGVGVAHSARYCNQPSPKNGGKYCLGERRRYRTCNVWRCSKTSKSVSFRTEQCREFNKIPYKNHIYNWLPVDTPIYPCELHCYTRDTERPFADRLRDKVVDGTKCFPHRNDICVDGVCKRLGCDKQIGSLASEDRCGVCRGDGTSCFDVYKTFNLTTGDEYVSIDLIPKGARQIRVVEAAPSGNFLALRNPTNGSEFYLNGNFMIQWEYQFDLAGTVFNYKRINKSVDKIIAEGPIYQDILVMLLFVEENPGVNISYIMPYNVTAAFQDQCPEFIWRMQPWSSCSRTCGVGIQMSLAVCEERKAGVVEENFCNQENKPNDEKRTCTNPDCTPEWSEAQWQPCSVTCGEDVGVQKRTVLCIRVISDDEQVVLNSTECDEALQPTALRPCAAKNHPMCPTWKTFSWQNCSEACGDGYRNRSVKCVNYVTTDVITLDNDGEDDAPLLDLDQESLSHQSSGATSKNTKISKTVLVERSSTPIKNSDFIEQEEEDCNPETRPHDVEPCNMQPCSTNQPRTSYGSGSTESVKKILNDSFMSLQLKNESLFEDHDLDFDVHDDISPRVAIDNRHVVNDENYEDILDVKTYASERKAHKTLTTYSTENDSIPSSGEYSSAYFNESTFYTGITTSTLAATTSSGISPSWLIGLWSQCSTTCGIGAKIRNVMCNIGSGRCDHLTKPSPAQRCYLKPCAKWLYAGWTRCSKLCGMGRKTRKVECRDEHTSQFLPLFHCHFAPRLPRVNASCSLRSCLPWRISSWSKCNVTCGMGVQRRRVACLKRGMCDLARRPVSQRNCKLRNCVEWKAFHWGRVKMFRG